MSNIEEKQLDTLQGATATEDVSTDAISKETEAPKIENGDAVKFTLENPAPAPPPENMDSSENPIPDHQAKYASTSIRNIKRLKDAKPFIQPVDPTALNIPQYYHFVKRPMSISVIEEKINKKVYSDVEDFYSDFKLMIDNAIKFNGEKSLMASLANNLLQTFTKHMHNMPPRENVKNIKQEVKQAENELISNDTSTISSISSRKRRQVHPPQPKDIYTNEVVHAKPKDKNLLQDLNFAKTLVKELLSKKYQNINFPFSEPVDTVALNIPHYHDYVKTPMDLSTIQKKLNNWEYTSFEAVTSDIDLVFFNCYAFNPAGSDVNIMGKSLERVYKDLLSKKPQPLPPTPPPVNNYSDQEESEEEQEEVEVETEEQMELDLINAGKNNPAILMLEQQIETFQEQLRAMREIEYKNLKKNKKLAKVLTKKAGVKRKRSANKVKVAGTSSATKRRKSSNSTTASGTRRKSLSASSSTIGKSDSSIQVSYEMKKYMSQKLEHFSMSEMNSFSTFIANNIPVEQMPKDESGEAYLDLSQLHGDYVLLLFNTFFKKYGDFYESVPVNVVKQYEKSPITNLPTSSIANAEPSFHTPSNLPSPFANASPVQRRTSQEGSAVASSGKLEQIKQKLQSMNNKKSPGTSGINSSASNNYSVSPAYTKPKGLYLNNDNDDESSSDDDDSESEEE